MGKDFSKGLKQGFGILAVLFLAFSVYAVGFHQTSEIVPGTFQGDYTFNGSVKVGTNSSLNYTNKSLEVYDQIIAGPIGGGNHLIVNDIAGAKWAIGTGDYAFRLSRHNSTSVENYSSWDEKFRISKKGNVGIGTTSPNEKLVVNGSVNLKGGNINYNGIDDWRLIKRETFENGDEGWGIATTSCNGANILGGYNVISGGEISKTYDLSNINQSNVKVILEYYAVDSWDGEWAYAYITGSEMNKVWNKKITNTDPGRKDVCGDTHQDGEYRIELSGKHTADTLKLIVGSTLDQAADDESFGVDNIEVWVR